MVDFKRFLRAYQYRRERVIVCVVKCTSQLAYRSTDAVETMRRTALVLLLYFQDYANAIVFVGVSRDLRH